MPLWRSGPCQGWDGGPDALLSSVPVSQTSGEKRPASHLSRCCGLTTSCSPGPMHRRGPHVPGPIQGKACSGDLGTLSQCTPWAALLAVTRDALVSEAGTPRPRRQQRARSSFPCRLAVSQMLQSLRSRHSCGWRCRGRVQCPPTLEGSVHPLVPLPGCTVVSLSVWGVSVSVLLK